LQLLLRYAHFRGCLTLFLFLFGNVRVNDGFIHRVRLPVAPRFGHFLLPFADCLGRFLAFFVQIVLGFGNVFARGSLGASSQ
jgi:hypothetical protein